MRTQLLHTGFLYYAVVSIVSCGTEGGFGDGMQRPSVVGPAVDETLEDGDRASAPTMMAEMSGESASSGASGVGGAGIDLIFPFSADDGCVLTRAYCAAASPWPTDLDANGVSTCSHRPTARFNDTYALDFANASAPVDIVATAQGIVASVHHEDANWGNRVFIDHGNGLYSLYGHLDRIDVVEGQRVHQGQTLGTMGNTGNSSGRHVHFSLMRGAGPDGPFEPVLPEPMSGYTDFHAHGRRVYGVDIAYPNLPVGTVVRARDRPEIYVVCGDMEKCHIEDWQAFATRRFFYDARDPTAQIVNLPEAALGCYAEGPPIQGVSVRALIRCGDGDHLYLSESGAVVRRRIPFDRTAQNYAYDAVLRSWGFSRYDWRDGSYAECHARAGDDLRLRDGTLIELPSDDDFYVVTADRFENEADQRGMHGYVRRIRREQSGVPFLPALYRTYNNVLMVLGDAVYTMTSGMVHGGNVFDAEAAADCRYGTIASGGGTEDPPVVGGDPPHTIRCAAWPDALHLRITGPVLDALIATPSAPVAIEYGSDTDGWSVPYAIGEKASAAWNGDGDHTMSLPPWTDRFNLYVVDSTYATRDSWFDLDASMDGFVPWSVVGDCRREGSLIVRGVGPPGTDDDGPPSPTTGLEDPSDGLLADTDASVTADGPGAHTIMCIRGAVSLAVVIRGPVLDALHGGTVGDPSSVQYGSNSPYLWDLPYDGQTDRAMAPWEGDGATYTLVLPRDADGMNIFLAGRNGGGRWFDLDGQDGNGVPWNVTGDCIRDGTLIRNVGQ